MEFNAEGVAAFIQLFNDRKQQIRDFAGCTHLELWQDADNENIFYTYSIWKDEAALNHYRFSEFFKDTWAKTKSLFSAKAVANSLIKKYEL